MRLNLHKIISYPQKFVSKLTQKSLKRLFCFFMKKRKKYLEQTKLDYVEGDEYK